MFCGLTLFHRCPHVAWNVFNKRAWSATKSLVVTHNIHLFILYYWSIVFSPNKIQQIKFLSQSLCVVAMFFVPGAFVYWLNRRHRENVFMKSDAKISSFSHNACKFRQYWSPWRSYNRFAKKICLLPCANLFRSHV